MKPTPEHDAEFKISDRRHWAPDSEEQDEAAEEREPSAVDGYRQEAEEAQAKLQEYIAAFKQHEHEQEEFRSRLNADVERRVELKFGEVVASLLETVDHLDMALAHADGIVEAEPLALGVAMSRKRFLATLETHGVRKISPQGEMFDPNFAEALRVDPVAAHDLDGTVTETLQAGYALGERVIRPARVAVGRYTAEDSSARLPADEEAR